MECPKCGHKNRTDAAVCSNCYFDLHSSKKPVTPVITKSSPRKSTPPPTPPPAPAQTGYQPAPGPVATAPPPSVPAPPGVGPVGMPVGGPAFAMTPIMNYASFWTRVGAYLIDGVIMGVVGFAIGAVAGGSAAMSGANMTPGSAGDPAAAALTAFTSAIAASGLSQLINLIYNVGMNGTTGATVGKMALGVRIVKEDGSPIGIGTALGRYILEIIFAGVTCGLAYIAVALSPTGQGWHDKVMKTVVIHTR